MKPVSIIFLIVSVILVIVGLIICSVSMLQAKRQNVDLYDTKIVNGQSEAEYDFSEDIISKIQIEVGDCDVHIICGADENKVVMNNFSSAGYICEVNNRALVVEDSVNVFNIPDIIENGKIRFKGFRYFLRDRKITAGGKSLYVYVSEKYNVLCRIVWTYDSSGVQSKKIYGSLYEPILMINRSARSKYIFNHEDILIEAKTGAKRKLIDYRKDPPQPYNTEKVPGNVWEFNRVRFKMNEYENHPTQKPESLIERIIKASSNVGDIVLDPFSGSFTTSTVAVKLGRIAIGIEMNEEYFEMGLRRTGIATEHNGKPLIKEKVRKTNAKSKYVRG